MSHFHVEFPDQYKGKFSTKEKFAQQKLMNNKLQNTYQKVKVLEASMFGHIYLNKKKKSTSMQITLPLLILFFQKIIKKCNVM